MTGCIFSIEEFSVYDGPGIRTTVFLKGCPLRCSWCHNPEGQAKEPEIVRSPNGCIGCRSCIRGAKEQDGKWLFSQESIENCPMGLIRVCGEITESDALCQRILKNEVILKNGGGVTFSGGEPLMQSEFLLACLRTLKGRLHTALQTCGYCDERVFGRVLENVDHVLYDLKLAQSESHRVFTGVDNLRILNNFSTLANSKKPFVVRIPLIPGVTDTEENLTAIAGILRDNRVRYAELLPYNRMAGGKYKMTQREYRPGFDESVPPNARRDVFDRFGIQIKLL